MLHLLASNCSAVAYESKRHIYFHYGTYPNTKTSCFIKCQPEVYKALASYIYCIQKGGHSCYSCILWPHISHPLDNRHVASQDRQAIAAGSIMSPGTPHRICKAIVGVQQEDVLRCEANQERVSNGPAVNH
jgi:hypothetical protein